MSATQQRPLFAVDHYLAMERAAEERHEYVDGRIFAMAGESDAHGDITVNLVGVIYPQLKGSPCRVRTKDTKVHSGPELRSEHTLRGMFSYPDIVVICGDLEFHDQHKDVILNPTAIVEVLSPSTAAFDRGEKFERYKIWNPTLRDYLLVAQDQPRIDHFCRQADGSWSHHVYTDLDAVVTIASIHCTLKLADVYDRVAFAAE